MSGWKRYLLVFVLSCLGSFFLMAQECCQLFDTDCDGIFNFRDQCPNDPDNDVDGDGICGDEDACPEIHNDFDGDGVSCPDDNCPADFNPDQADGDDDAVGDACDNCPNDPNGPNEDCDGDPATPDEQCDDGDNDGFGDVCDPCPDDPDNACQEEGRVLINEIMYDPSAVSDSVGEWIELVNLGPGVVDIVGWTILDASNAFAIIGEGQSSVQLLPGQFYLLGKSDQPSINGGVPNVRTIFSFGLSNASDEVILQDANGLDVDRVLYNEGGGWPACVGASLARIGTDLTDADGDGIPDGSNDPANWACATATYGDGDKGTPGAAN